MGMEMAGYRLYGRMDTGSAATEAALAEAGADFTVIAVPKDPDAAAADGYHRINPRGQVPALVHPDGTVITEGTAILLHIADAFPKAHLAPAPGSSARGRHDRWLLFFHANLYEGELRRFYPDRYTTDPDGVPGVQAAAEDYVKRHYVLFEAQLGEMDYALGPQIAVLDIYLWMLVQWFDRDWLADALPEASGRDRPRGGAARHRIDPRRAFRIGHCMATDRGTVDYIVEQAAGAGGVSARAMFGEYALYCDGKVVALICDDQLFLKPTDAGRAILGPDPSMGAAYPGAKPSYADRGRPVGRRRLDGADRPCDGGRPAAAETKETEGPGNDKDRARPSDRRQR